MTEPDHIDRPGGPMRTPAPDDAVSGRPRRWTSGKSAAVRSLLLILSIGGMLAVVAAWMAGHGGLAFRILAGEIVAIVAVLLLL